MELDYKVALRCAHLSNEVYRDFNERLRFSMRPNLMPTLFDIERTDTQVALLEDPETQCGYVIFRGSDADRDWLTNLDFARWSAVTGAVIDNKQLDYPAVYGTSQSGVKMHSGFTKAYLAARSEIQSVVHQSEMTRWLVTGHSLGGALAKLCAVDLQYNFSPDISVEVYTFGAPRVGNKAFAESYNRRVPNTWRFVNGNDVVSGLPRRWQRYRHVDERIRFNVMFSWRIISGSLQDHRIDRYIAALEKRADQEK
ncbi:lipase family protein [Leptolyngbyaceae cyanobacterium CCMR0082]|uniref:Lipase family protein n=2 Tax=Adonisia turfae TaxID=2950184 RepID=A0A6M0SCM9_9CYAN|nr:lipase family protein [Adonisia turfae]MDV3351344.1 lipase family protein [Leptothoe sp. LEGE 181152]NEZ60198.1 lipase family protein [Adonisia turfae CCMR0081]NEZ66224.1 lipase family protein [Adonisia turfae CCMR0082]